MILDTLITSLSATNLGAAFGGTLLGVIMGALPGIGATMTMALVLPFTFWMDPATALILLGAIYCGATYGGSISAILINTPGTPASTATVFDGYPLARQGKAMNAIGIAAMASLVGGLFGLVILVFTAPLMAEISLLFGPAEFFMLVLFTFIVISMTIVKDSVLKGLVAIGLGLVLSVIGYDPVSGAVRFTFGLAYFDDGIQLVPAIIGLFAISEVFSLAQAGGTISKALDVKGSLVDGFRAVFRYPATIIRSSLIGSGVGALPGIGVSAANLIAYVVAKGSSPDGARFGEGMEEGVVAPEVSNNAVTATSLIPTLTLGIPGSSSAALLLGALMVHGLIPGASLFTERAGVTYTFFWGLLFANLFMIVVTFMLVRAFVKITTVNAVFLVPIITGLCLIGAYAIRNSVGDMAVAFAFGVLGYVMSRLKYDLICLLLPLMLGTMMERSYHQALMLAKGSHAIFIMSPISKCILAMCLFAVVYPMYLRVKKKRAQRQTPASP